MFNEQLVTVWSAPNYCYRCGNVAAILELDENLHKLYKLFEAAPQVNLKDILFTANRKTEVRPQKNPFLIISFKCQEESFLSLNIYNILYQRLHMLRV
jgi:hypothetical protein